MDTVNAYYLLVNNGGKKMPKVSQDHEKCIGCGACVAICPENWEMGDDGKANLKNEVIADDQVGCNQEAANQCPVQIITVE